MRNFPNFHIFHTNARLECHFDELHHFLSESCLDFKAICISETLQLNDSKFGKNVDKITQFTQLKHKLQNVVLLFILKIIKKLLKEKN